MPDDIDFPETDEELPQKMAAAPPPLQQSDPSSESDIGETLRVFLREDYSTEGSLENIRNRERLEQFRRFSSMLLELIAEGDFEYGFDNTVDSFLRRCLNENELATKEWLNDLFIENFADAVLTTGILRVIAHLDYYDVTPQGPTMALAALAHADVEVRECGIRAFENWGRHECLKVLRTVSCEEEWLRSYVGQVVSDLEEALGHVPASKKS